MRFLKFAMAYVRDLDEAGRADELADLPSGMPHALPSRRLTRIDCVIIAHVHDDIMGWEISAGNATEQAAYDAYRRSLNL